MPSFYTSPRIKEISQTLIDDIRLYRRIKRLGMIEKTSLLILKLEDWPDWRVYRYQPRNIASAVAFAEWHRDIPAGFQNDKTKAQKEKKNTKQKIFRQIKKIEVANNMDFDELPDEIRMRSFIKRDGDGNYMLRDLLSASIAEMSADQKIKKWTHAKTKPPEKALQWFCRDMKSRFVEKSQKLNYRLIADIANLFSLSKIEQSYNTIKERFSRDKL